MDLLLRPWRLYADTSGRSRRAEIWLFYVVKCAMLLVIGVAAGALETESSSAHLYTSPVAILVVVWLVATFVPSMALIIRWLHDFGFSGKWVLATFIPYLGFIVLFGIGLVPGAKGENGEGKDPREIAPDAMAEVFE